MNVELNSFHQGTNVGKRPSAQSFVGDLAEPAFHHVEPGTRCRDEVQMETGMTYQPRLDTRMLMRPVVVHDQMQAQPGWRLRINSLKEPDELLMPMTRHAIPDDLSVKHVQRREQGRGAVAFIIVGRAGRKPGAQGQP